MSWETIISVVIGGLLTFFGSFFMFRQQQKMSELAWERQEMRRKEERSFELKRQAYHNYLMLIAQSVRNPVKPIEVKVALAFLELNGSPEVMALASEYAKLMTCLTERGVDPNTDPEATKASDRLLAAMLEDFRSHNSHSVK